MHTRSGARLQNDILKLNFCFLFYPVTLELIIEKQTKAQRKPNPSFSRVGNTSAFSPAEVY